MKIEIESRICYFLFWRRKSLGLHKLPELLARGDLLVQAAKERQTPPIWAATKMIVIIPQKEAFYTRLFHVFMFIINEQI